MISRILKSLHLVQWSLRKTRLPIRRSDLVLDVGSGANPHPRADVLIEKHLGGQHRHGTRAVVDRPMVFADACQMPFRDRAFDFVIAAHVLEHMADPAAFLNELMRVGKAGYIETPNVIFERLVPYDVHLLEVMDISSRLYLRKKPAPATDTFCRDLQIVPRSEQWKELFYGNPRYFHVCYTWYDRIDFVVVNPDERCDWFREAGSVPAQGVAAGYSVTNWRSLGMAALRRLYRLRRPPAHLPSLLVCPNCRGELSQLGAWLCCANCRRRYPSLPWPDFTVSSVLQ